MAQSMLKAVVVKRSKTLFGKRVKNQDFVATVGPLEAVDVSKEAAVFKVEREVLAALGRLDTGISIIQQHGLTGVIFPTLDRWSSQIVGSHLVSGPFSLEEVESRLRHHMAQNAWNMDVEDDVIFLNEILDQRARKDMETWIRWQRDFETIRLCRPDLPNHAIHGMASSQNGRLRHRNAGGAV